MATETGLPRANATVMSNSLDEDEERLQAELSRIREWRALVQEMYKLKEEGERLTREKDAIMSKFRKKGR